MFKKLNHYLQKFSYTRLDDDEFLLRPFILKISEDTAFSLVERLYDGVDSVIVDRVHKEIFLKENNVETTILFTNGEDHKAIVSINTFSKKSGIAYKRLIKEKDKLSEIFKSYIVSK